MRGATFNLHPRFVPPADGPEGTIYIRVACPRGDDWEALFRGALLSLTDIEAWHVRPGAVLPEDCAQAFVDAWSDPANWEECGGGGGIVLPVGSIFIWPGGGDLPNGCLECDGSQVSQEAYSELYAVVGDIYGSADPGYFRLPDLAGRCAIGAGSGSGLTPRSLGDSGGEEEHQLTVSEMPQHFHTIGHSTTTANLQVGTTALRRPTLASEDTSMAGLNAAHNNMQPFLALRFVIVALSGE